METKYDGMLHIHTICYSLAALIEACSPKHLDAGCSAWGGAHAMHSLSILSHAGCDIAVLLRGGGLIVHMRVWHAVVLLRACESMLSSGLPCLVFRDIKIKDDLQPTGHACDPLSSPLFALGALCY